MAGRTSTIRVVVLFAIVFLVVVAWVSASDGDGANAARHFLSNLLRHLF